MGTLVLAYMDKCVEEIEAFWAIAYIGAFLCSDRYLYAAGKSKINHEYLIGN